MSDNGGERELILGNKQILAVFFVVAVLCGVFFAMGYVVGGNSAKAGAATAVADAAVAQVSNEGKREQPQAPRDIAPTANGTQDANTPLPGPEPRISDNPAAVGAQAAATPAAVQAETPPPAPKQAAHTAGVAVPEAGASYLQVAALEMSDADKLVTSLRARDLPAILAEGRQVGQFRVLVGPYRTTLLQADAKTKLKALGFNDVFAYKP